MCCLTLASACRSVAQAPLLRLCWNKQMEHHVACISMDSDKVVILDIRCAATPHLVLLTSMSSPGALDTPWHWHIMHGS